MDKFCVQHTRKYTDTQKAPFELRLLNIYDLCACGVSYHYKYSIPLKRIIYLDTVSQNSLYSS